MKKTILALLLFQSVARADSNLGVKQCTDSIMNDIIGWGYVAQDYVFIPSAEDASKFFISNGLTHYSCTTAPDLLKDRNQIFINQNIEGFSKTYIAVQNDNRKSWGLIPIAKIDNKLRNLVADCKKSQGDDKEAVKNYTHYTKSLIKELKLDYPLKVSEIVSTYGLIKETKVGLSNKMNSGFYKTLDLCRAHPDLASVAKNTEKGIRFVTVNDKNGQAKLPSRDISAPTKVQPMKSGTLPPATNR